jgi:hypothetical protein
MPGRVVWRGLGCFFMPGKLRHTRQRREEDRRVQVQARAKVTGRDRKDR